jgi:hypothetical protein
MGASNPGLSMSDMGANDPGLLMSDMGANQNNMQMNQMQMNNMQMSQGVVNNGQMPMDNTMMSNVGGMNEQPQSDLQMLNDNDADTNNSNTENSDSLDNKEETKDLNSISMDEMNKKYIEMMSGRHTSFEETQQQEVQPQVEEALQPQASPYYQADTINSMRLNTLYVDDNKDEEEDNIAKEKKDKMYIYLQEDGINVDDGLDNCSNDVLEYEKILKEFYNYSHKNVRSIIGLWNEKKFEEYYISH